MPTLPSLEAVQHGQLAKELGLLGTWVSHQDLVDHKSQRPVNIALMVQSENVKQMLDCDSNMGNVTVSSVEQCIALSWWITCHVTYTITACGSVSVHSLKLISNRRNRNMRSYTFHPLRDHCQLVAAANEQKHAVLLLNLTLERSEFSLSVRNEVSTGNAIILIQHAKQQRIMHGTNSHIS